MEEKIVETLEENKTVETEAKAEVKEEGVAPKKEFRGKNDRRNSKGGKKFDRKKGPREEVKKEFEERLVFVNRVSKTVKGGRRMKFAVLVVVGNGKGKYGFATGKSGEVPDAIKKAVDKAKRNTFDVKITKNGSIAHEVIGNYGATKVFLKPAPEGTGIIAGGPVRAILELSGVRNVYSKVYGSRTSINAIRATQVALSLLKDHEKVMALRKGGAE